MNVDVRLKIGENACLAAGSAITLIATTAAVTARQWIYLAVFHGRKLQ